MGNHAHYNDEGTSSSYSSDSVIMLGSCPFYGELEAMLTRSLEGAGRCNPSASTICEPHIKLVVAQ